MPLLRALVKNMAASYFGESALRFCNGSYTSVCLYSVAEVNYEVCTMIAQMIDCTRCLTVYLSL